MRRHKLINQFVTAETNENSSKCSKTVTTSSWSWTIFIIHHTVGSVHEVQNKTDCVGTLCANRKDVPPVVKNKKLKNEEHCGQPSGDVTDSPCMAREGAS